MNGLLSMIGIQTELDYLIGDFPACFGDTPLAIPKGSIPSDKQKCQIKAQHEFTIKGIKIMAAPRRMLSKSLIIVKSEANEQIRIYIPGDLVIVKESALQFAKDKIFKVISSLSGGFLKLVMLNDSSTIYSISNNAIRPIPLTPDILEKNGWKLSHGFYWSPNEEGAGIGLSSETGYVWKSYLGRQPLRSNINSVSDLQHLLFGIGLNSEMEV